MREPEFLSILDQKCLLKVGAIPFLNNKRYGVRPPARVKCIPTNCNRNISIHFVFVVLVVSIFPGLAQCIAES